MEKNLAGSKKRLFSSLRRNIKSESVIGAMEKIPRERFVLPEARHLAYTDIPTSIGEGQTISQPYIVALMVEGLGLRGHEKVLEVGTGSGYQAAVLSLLVPRGRVVTVELLPSLAERARRLLRDLGTAQFVIGQGHRNIAVPSRAPSTP